MRVCPQIREGASVRDPDLTIVCSCKPIFSRNARRNERKGIQGNERKAVELRHLRIVRTNVKKASTNGEQTNSSSHIWVVF